MTQANHPWEGMTLGGYPNANEKELYRRWVAGPGGKMNDANSTATQRMAEFERWKKAQE